MTNFLPPGLSLNKAMIGRRLLLSILLFSSLVTIISTVFQLYLDFQKEVEQIEDRLDDVQNSYMASIGATLWNLDIAQLNLQMEGLRQLPDVVGVQIEEAPSNIAEPLRLSLGQFTEKGAINRIYPITHLTENGLQPLGALTVQASLEAVYSRLWGKLIVILFSQGIQTFLVSLFILFIFHRLVTSHLMHIAQHVGKFDLDTPQLPLTLDRASRDQRDELDQVIHAFNKMSDSLTIAYEGMRNANKALAQDIIARRKAEQEVRKLNAELEYRVSQRTAELQAANEELSSFCYSVSHELRAPLRRVEGFRRLLLEDSGDLLTSQSQHCLSRIEEGTTEMTGMIDGFLRLSRSTLGEVNLEDIDITAQTKQLLNALQEREPERTVTVEIDNDMHAVVDRRFFVMLMNNLLDNAFKYSRHQPQAHIHVGQYTKAGQTVFFVRDNGAGFDMEYADRLFAPFSRLHKPEEFEGTGIGLATVQRIISRHGGKIWAESVPNEGATFYFSFTEDVNKSHAEGPRLGEIAS